MGETLTAAIAGTERGEVWEDGHGWILALRDGRWYGVAPDNRCFTIAPPATGWRRAESELRCPRGHRAKVRKGVAGDWCVECEIIECWQGPMMATEAEALEAWERIGGLRWRKPEEWREGNGWSLWLFDNGGTGTLYHYPGSQRNIVAFVYTRDLPLPPWAKE